MHTPTFVARPQRIIPYRNQSRERAIVAVLVLSTVLLGGCRKEAALAPVAQLAPRVERLPANPIVTPTMLQGNDGENINGPSLIRVPNWVQGRLGEYYLYFSHHAGNYIRMAYANDVAGPWTVYEPGTLRMENTVCNDITDSAQISYRHVASADVHIDAASQQIRMYFHCPVYVSGPTNRRASYRQVSLVATSNDGLSFTAQSETLGNSYFRVFQWAGQTYALGMPGIVYRSADGLRGFEQGPTLFSPDMRHTAVAVRDGKLMVLYTMVGDNPERILLSEIDLRADWMQWRATDPVTVLSPEREWEGASLPPVPSARGEIAERARQLRDPALFTLDGRTYLLYSVAGESGIAIAELFWR